jgi:hypothetical protein
MVHILLGGNFVTIERVYWFDWCIAIVYQIDVNFIGPTAIIACSNAINLAIYKKCFQMKHLC